MARCCGKESLTILRPMTRSRSCRANGASRWFSLILQCGSRQHDGRVPWNSRLALKASWKLRKRAFAVRSSSKFWAAHVHKTGREWLPTSSAFPTSRWTTPIGNLQCGARGGCGQGAESSVERHSDREPFGEMGLPGLREGPTFRNPERSDGCSTLQNRLWRLLCAGSVMSWSRQRKFQNPSILAIGPARASGETPDAAVETTAIPRSKKVGVCIFKIALELYRKADEDCGAFSGAGADAHFATVRFNYTSDYCQT